MLLPKYNGDPDLTKHKATACHSNWKVATMKVLVTGANGFIGTYLVQSLLKKNYEVRCLVLESDPLRGLKDLPVEIIYGDICDRGTLAPAVTGVDIIFHLAALMTAWDEETYMRVNYHGMQNIIDAALENNKNLKRFLFVSTQAVAGPSSDERALTEEDPPQPLSLYAASKLAAEEYLHTLNDKVPITIVRPAIVYGPFKIGMSVIGLMLKSTRWGVAPNIFAEDQLMNALYVKDLVRGLIMAMECEAAAGQTYFLTSKHPYTWRELVKAGFRAWGRKGLVIRVPKVLVSSGAAVLKFVRKLRGKPVGLIDDFLIQMFHPKWVCNGEKAWRDFGFETSITLDDGLRDTVAWHESVRSESSKS